MNPWYLYILLCKNNKLYIGITKDVKKRFELHKINKGAKFTQKNKPIKIVYIEKLYSLSEARKREIQIKKWSRKKKEDLINGKISK